METLFEDVKYNCDVSDARYWGSFSICGLLMRVRDLYRSELGMDPWERIPQDEISPWLDRKESVWKELENKEFRKIRLGGFLYDPFDADGINVQAGRSGLVYGAGYGLYGKPTFFVAEAGEKSVEKGHDIVVACREHVRDIFSSAGMSQGKAVLLRLWPLRAFLWEKMAETRPEAPSCLHHVLSARRLSDGPGKDMEFRGRFEELARTCGRLVIDHELAESLEDAPDWPELIRAADDRAAEYFLRATKDLIADTSDFGPLRRVISACDDESLCLFSLFFGPYHRKLSPELSRAVKRCLEDRDWDSLDAERVRTFRSFQARRDRLLEAFGSSGDVLQSMGRVRELICRFTTGATS